MADPLQYSCLENPMDRGASKLQSMGSQVSDMTKQLTYTVKPLAPNGFYFSHIYQIHNDYYLFIIRISVGQKSTYT